MAFSPALPSAGEPPFRPPDSLIVAETDASRGAVRWNSASALHVAGCCGRELLNRQRIACAMRAGCLPDSQQVTPANTRSPALAKARSRILRSKISHHERQSTAPMLGCTRPVMAQVSHGRAGYFLGGAAAGCNRKSASVIGPKLIKGAEVCAGFRLAPLLSMERPYGTGSSGLRRINESYVACLKLSLW